MTSWRQGRAILEGEAHYKIFRFIFLSRKGPESTVNSTTDNRKTVSLTEPGEGVLLLGWQELKQLVADVHV